MEKAGDPLYIYPEKEIDNIALQASDKNEFQDAIRSARTKLEAIKTVRVLLLESFPEFESLPQPLRRETANLVGGRVRSPVDRPLSNDYIAARKLVDLLWEEDR